MAGRVGTFLAAVGAWLATACLPAQATTIDTFAFSIIPVGGDPATDWYSVSTPPVPTGTFLVGSFSGVVEANGLIELGDLQSFSAALYALEGTTSVGAPSDLSLFSYDTAGGASSLDFATNSHFFVCVGAAATLDPQCGAGTVAYPANTTADALIGPPAIDPGYTYATVQPLIQLVSSTTIPSTPVPAPTSLPLFASGLGALFLWRRRREAAAGRHQPGIVVTRLSKSTR